MTDLAIIASHPIQYYAPWFRYLNQSSGLKTKTFYLWDFGIKQQQDIEFKSGIQWDIPLLDGYAYEFVPNISQKPTTKRLWGLNNPTLIERVLACNAKSVLMMNYNYITSYRFLLEWACQKAPLLFRGDSHVLQAPRGIKPWLKRRWITQVYRQFDGCLYVGQANRAYFQYHGVPDEKLFFSSHAIDNNRFIQAAAQASEDSQQWKQSLGIPLHHQVILFAGKLIEKKRPQDLLAAFARAQLKDVSLLFVGSGPLEALLRDHANEIENVYFAPFQNQSEMPRTYAIASIVVLPSYGTSETWGLSINEAMCIGKPVIVSDHVGCAADLVKDNGWVFPAGKQDALAACLREAFEEPTALEKKGQRSQQLIKNYSYKQTTTGLIQAIEHCL